jgi:anti-anti-sigma factor
VLAGELDLAEAGRVAEAIDTAARPGGAVVVDVRRLEFMDSTGLSTIISADAAAKRQGWDLAVICDGGGPVHRLFDLTDTRAVLRFVATSAELDG